MTVPEPAPDLTPEQLDIATHFKEGESAIPVTGTDMDDDHVPDRYADPNNKGEGYAFACMADDCAVVTMGSTPRGAAGAMARHVAALHPDIEPFDVDKAAEAAAGI